MESVAEFFEKFGQRAAENNDAATAPWIGRSQAVCSGKKALSQTTAPSPPRAIWAIAPLRKTMRRVIFTKKVFCLPKTPFVTATKGHIGARLQKQSHRRKTNTGAAPGAQRNPSAQIEQLSDVVQHLSTRLACRDARG